MDSVFMEKIVRKQRVMQDYLKMAAYIIIPVFILAIAIQIPLLQAFFPLLAIGLSVGAWWLLTGLNREYEYIVTDQFIDIDCIIAKRKRVRVFSGDAKEFEIAAGADTEFYDEYSKKNLPILNLAPSEDHKQNYFIVTKNNAKKAKTRGQNVLVFFEPDQKMMVSLHKYNPLRIKQ
jgi:hypothetical protein